MKKSLIRRNIKNENSDINVTIFNPREPVVSVNLFFFVIRIAQFFAELLYISNVRQLRTMNVLWKMKKKIQET